MPTLSNEKRPTKVIKFKGVDGVEDGTEIEVYMSLTIKDGIDTQADESEMLAKTPLTLQRWIKKWNYTDENGQPLELSIENISLLPMSAVNKIMQELGFLDKDTKDT